MKNKKIVFLSLGLLLIVTTLVISISAWLTDVDETPDTTFTIGDVEYTIVGDFIADGIVVPGQELIDGNLSLTNSSTVTSELRVRVIVTRKEGLADAAVVADLSSILTTDGSSGGNFVFAPGWEKHLSETNAWYYKPSGNPVIPNSGQSITVLSTLKFDGSKVGNSFSNNVFTIKFIFEAKQAEHVTWSELATYSFSSGLPS